jgi:hypothetical protein
MYLATGTKIKTIDSRENKIVAVKFRIFNTVFLSDLSHQRDRTLRKYQT